MIEEFSSHLIKIGSCVSLFAYSRAGGGRKEGR